MASKTTRSASRLLRKALRSQNGTQTLPGYAAVRGMHLAVEMQPAFVEDIQEPVMKPYLEAIRHWQETTQMLSELRVTDAQELATENTLAQEQMADLLETLVDEQVLDFRHGWGVTGEF